MLSIDHGVLATFDWRNNDWRKLGPVEVFRNLTNVCGPASAVVTLIAQIDDEIFDLDPQQLRCRPRFELGFGRLKMIARYRFEHRKFLSPERDCSREIVSRVRYGIRAGCGIFPVMPRHTGSAPLT